MSLANPFFKSQLAVLSIFTAALSIATSRLSNARRLALPDQSASSSLATRYLLVYAIIMMSDWLQGPYMYHLLNNEHHFSPNAIATLFVIGFGTAAVCSPFIGRLADVYGRKNLTVLFCFLYSCSCFMICLPSWTACVIARICGGVATSILFSVPESWLVSAAHEQDLSSADLSPIFGRAAFLNGLVAVLSGILSNYLVQLSGTSKTPFRLAIGLLIVAALLMRFSWKENFGQSKGTVRNGAISDAIQKIRNDTNLRAIVTTQTIFETSMYLFVFLWVPTMEEKASLLSYNLGLSLPLGLIFASFMCCMMLGSLLYSHIIRYSTVDDSMATNIQTQLISTDNPVLLHSKMLGLLTLVATVALGVSNYTSNLKIVFWSFCIFEATVGVYFPTLGWLKSELVADEVRATYSSIFRMPLNVLVTSSLLVGIEKRKMAVFAGITIALTLASTIVNHSLVRGQLCKASASELGADSLHVKSQS